MGSGVAKAIREKWPRVYEDYKNEEKFKGLYEGSTIYTTVAENLVVASTVTQEFYGRDKSKVYVDYHAIQCCFSWIRRAAENTGLPVHFPLIGCGLANGNWGVVSSIIEEALGPDIKSTLWLLEEKL
jgi:O-acetyl-ADP-ribose deacetylase (regulator of RNase III)